MKAFFLIILFLCLFLLSSLIYTQILVEDNQIENKKDVIVNKKPKITITVRHFSLPSSPHYPYYKYDPNKQTSVKKPLVWSFGYSYNWERMRLFVKSLRQSGYDGDLVIGISDYLYDELEDKLTKYKIKPIIIEDKWPFYSNKNNKYFPINDSFIKENMIEERYYDWNDKWNVYRFSILNMWLLVYGSIYSHIISIDIRDVVFQGDPFKWNFEDVMYMVDESIHNMTLRDEVYNRRWIEVYDDYEKILNERVLNSGTLFGSSFYFIKFINQFTEFLRNDKHITNEQGTLNYLYHTNYFKDIKFLMNRNEYGLVYTMALDHIYFHEISTFNIRNNILYNKDNTKPLIIHQYDRHRHFVELFTNQVLYTNE